MSSDIQTPASPSLSEQRHQMRQKIREQRAVIENQLAPMQPISRTYPRSKIMRFFVQRPGLAVKLLTEVGGIFIGATFLKSASTAFSVFRNLR